MRGNNGGYVMIDFKDIDITTAPKKIDGVYNKIENSYRKAIMLTNLVINGVEKNDAFAEPILESSNYQFKLYKGTIEVTSENQVKFTADAVAA